MDDIKPTPDSNQNPPQGDFSNATSPEPAAPPPPAPPASGNGLPNEVPGVSPADAPAPDPAFGMHDPTSDASSRPHVPHVTPKSSLIAAAVVLLLLLAGALAYYRFVYLSPSHVTARAFSALTDVQSLSYEIDIATGPASATAAAPQPPRFIAAARAAEAGGSDKITASGQLDWHNKKQPLMSLEVRGGTGTEAFGLSTKFNDFKVYAQATTLPKVDGVDYSPLANKWVAFDMKDARQEWEKAVDQQKIDKDKVKKIKEVLQKHTVFQVDKKLPDEKVGGVSSWHFTYKVNKEGAKAAGPEIAKIIDGKDMTSEDKESFNTSIDEIDTSGTEIWLGKGDSLIHRLRYQDPKNNSGTVTLTLSNYNKPAKVDRPTDSQTLDQLVKSVRHTGPDTDKDGLSDLAEEMYFSDKTQPDSDADGHRDGAEVDRGFNPNGPGTLPSIEDQLGTAFLGGFAYAASGAFSSGAQGGAEDAKAQSDVMQVVTALEQYTSDNGVYPKQTPAAVITSASPAGKALGDAYLVDFPRDVYYISDGNRYAVCKSLSDGKYYRVTSETNETKSGNASSCSL